MPILPPSFQLDDTIGSVHLTAEMKEVLRAISLGESPLFIGGNAGTGKSTLLKLVRQNSNQTLAVLAPTGSAALNVRGSTIHSFFQFPPGLMTNHQFKTRRTFKEVCKQLSGIVIDEISMVRADLLDAIDVSLKMHLNSRQPFGGIPMVFFGDAAQLPPVVSGHDLQKHFAELYQSPYFFDAACMRAAGLKQYWLTQFFRQSDPGFVRLLNRVRTAQCEPDEIHFLNSQVDINAEQNFPDAITLTTTRSTADDTNRQRLNELPGSTRTFTATINGNVRPNAYPTAAELQLKTGARVVLLQNNRNLWSNGTLGTVVGFGKHDGEECVNVEMESGRHWVKPSTWDVIQYRPKDSGPGLAEEVVGSFRQLPIKLAWAITIHKSQGMTFDKVVLNLGTGAFEYGQLYVALSRCRSLSGLKLIHPIRLSDLRYHPRVRWFEQQCKGNMP